MPTKFVSRRAALPRSATGVTPSNCAMGFAVISIARSFTFRVQPSSASVVVPRHQARAQGVPSMITKRIWKSGPRRIKRVAWGFTAQRDGKQVRRFREEWTKEDAERAFSEWTLGVEAPALAPAPAGMTFGAMVERFIAKKKSEGKRSIQDDEERSVPLLAFFGKATPLAAIRTRRVAEYRMARRATTSRLGRPLAPATVNREVALLRSILRMALAWDELERVPVFEMTKEQGKQRYLALDEITRLLAACAESRSRLLLAIVTVALHTGLRKGELLRLIWERVDFARSVIALGRQTKSGKGRDVPINQAVYGALAPLRAAAGGQDASGRVWGALRDIAPRTARRSPGRRSSTPT